MTGPGAPTAEEVAASTGGDLSILKAARHAVTLGEDDGDDHGFTGPSRHVMRCTECRCDRLTVTEASDGTPRIECDCTIVELGNELPDHWTGEL